MGVGVLVGIGGGELVGCVVGCGVGVGPGLGVAVGCGVEVGSVLGAGLGDSPGIGLALGVGTFTGGGSSRGAVGVSPPPPQAARAVMAHTSTPCCNVRMQIDSFMNNSLSDLDFLIKRRVW
jgi:hypothetical protein